LPAALAGRGRGNAAYLHLDLDALDPAEARINVFPAAGGLARADLAWAVETIGATVSVEAASLTAYDPGSDPDGTGREAALALAETVVRAAARPG
jgi:arginase